jgi:formyl-CoA transferase
MQYDHAAVAGRLNCVGHPVTFFGEERSAGLPPPMLGQHTNEILREMGLSTERIDQLHREEVVG